MNADVVVLRRGRGRSRHDVRLTPFSPVSETSPSEMGHPHHARIAPCPGCGEPVPPKVIDKGGSAKVYCSARCKRRVRDRRRAPPAVGPRSRPCQWCGVITDRPKFCSDGCKQRAMDGRKAERYHQDPAYRRKQQLRMSVRELNKRRAAGIGPYVPAPPRLCGFPGCLRKHYAKGLCKRHWAAGREELPKLALPAVVRAATGPPVLRVVECVMATGLIPFCFCGRPTGGGTFTRRECTPCGLTFTLNGEEVAWLNAEAHGPPPLRPLVTPPSDPRRPPE